MEPVARAAHNKARATLGTVRAALEGRRVAVSMGQRLRLALCARCLRRWRGAVERAAQLQLARFELPDARAVLAATRRRVLAMWLRDWRTNAAACAALRAQRGELVDLRLAHAALVRRAQRVGKARRCFGAWWREALAAVLRRQRAQLDNLDRRAEELGAQVRRRDALIGHHGRKAISRARTRLLMRFWRQWASGRAKRGRLAARGAAILKQLTLRAAWNAWFVNSRSLRRLRVALRRAVRRTLRRAMAGAFDTWAERVPRRRLLRRALRRMTRRSLATAWEGWACGTRDRRVARVAVARSLARMHARSLAAAYAQWAWLTERATRERSALASMARELRKLLYKRTFDEWVKVAKQSAATRRNMRFAARRLAYWELRRAFNCWTAYVQGRKLMAARHFRTGYAATAMRLWLGAAKAQRSAREAALRYRLRRRCRVVLMSWWGAARHGRLVTAHCSRRLRRFGDTYRLRGALRTWWALRERAFWVGCKADRFFLRVVRVRSRGVLLAWAAVTTRGRLHRSATLAAEERHFAQVRLLLPLLEALARSLAAGGGGGTKEAKAKRQERLSELRHARRALTESLARLREGTGKPFDTAAGVAASASLVVDELNALRLEAAALRSKRVEARRLVKAEADAGVALRRSLAIAVRERLEFFSRNSLEPIRDARGQALHAEISQLISALTASSGYGKRIAAPLAAARAVQASESAADEARAGLRLEVGTEWELGVEAAVAQGIAEGLGDSVAEPWEVSAERQALFRPPPGAAATPVDLTLDPRVDYGMDAAGLPPEPESSSESFPAFAPRVGVAKRAVGANALGGKRAVWGGPTAADAQHVSRLTRARAPHLRAPPQRPHSAVAAKGKRLAAAHGLVATAGQPFWAGSDAGGYLELVQAQRDAPSASQVHPLRAQRSEPILRLGLGLADAPPAVRARVIQTVAPQRQDAPQREREAELPIWMRDHLFDLPRGDFPIVATASAQVSGTDTQG